VETVKIRLGDLAAELGREVEGDPEVWLDGVAPLESAEPGDLSFVRTAKLISRLEASRAGAVIAPPDLDVGSRPVMRSPNPDLDFARAARRIVPEAAAAPGIHPFAHVDPGAQVDETASIGPGCVVGPACTIGAGSVLSANVTVYADVAIGKDCLIHAGCVLRERTVLGDRVILQPRAVLGGDGFGYVPNAEGGFEKAPQVGRVVVGNDVEIGAGTAVDRGTLGDTTIGASAKIDNLVQIAHNCSIGEKALIVAQAGLAGSTRVEANAIIMGQAGVVGHLTIGAGAFIGPQTGVHKDVDAGARVLGTPQREHRNWHRLMAALTRLPALFARVRSIERRLGIREIREGDPPDGEPPDGPDEEEGR
jgi:UDP-3-O-[3-hydroxymyristoyl] glucosamine N-acyltransferase